MDSIDLTKPLYVVSSTKKDGEKNLGFYQDLEHLTGVVLVGLTSDPEMAGVIVHEFDALEMLEYTADEWMNVRGDKGAEFNWKALTI